MKHYLPLYELASDYLERRAALRNDHLSLAWEAHARGELVLGGALDPADGAVLLFRGESRDVASTFAENDPYVKDGLVIAWSVRQWTTVVGDDATDPVRPEV